MGTRIHKGSDVMANEKVSYDHLGNRYKSVSEMCRHWNIGMSVYSNRIHRGKSLEEALTEPVKRYKNEDTTGKTINKWVVLDGIEDTNGKIKVRCLLCGVTYKVTKHNIESGKSSSCAKCYHRLSGEQNITIGNVVYANRKEACEAFNLKVGRVKEYSRRHNISTAKAIQEINEKRNEFEYEGKLYTGLSEWCKDNDVSYNIAYKSTSGIRDNEVLFNDKLKGLVELKRGYKHNNIITFEGKEYRNMGHIADEFKVNKDIYRCRIYRGWSMKESLGLCGRGLRRRVGTTYYNIQIIEWLYKGRDELDYYLCKVGEIKKILNENNWTTYVKG